MSPSGLRSFSSVEVGVGSSGEIGEMALGVSDPDLLSRCIPPPPSESLASERFRGLPPGREFFCLNFSNQATLLTLAWHS